ncbi:hypothetical protein CAEBREN_14216 [Caenorhabditis brenneri]|uniref:SET domain-containing protein n=1 Tax=Caenorhabditis brenneri TaxID=135651 RepID=G0M7I5_CAEBE|nr:hypothetical protein CAEBREN_14216 [Caenorhabditis brenneri]
MSRIQPTEVFDGPPSLLKPGAPSSNNLTNQVYLPTQLNIHNSDPDATEGGSPNTNIPNNQEHSQQEQINIQPHFGVAPNMDSFSLQALQNMLALFFHYYKNGKYQNVIELNKSSSQQMNKTQQIQPPITSLTEEQVHSLEKWISERKTLIEEVCTQIKQGKMVTEAIPTTLDNECGNRISSVVRKEVTTSPLLAASVTPQQPATNTKDQYRVRVTRKKPVSVPEPVASQTVADQVHNIEEIIPQRIDEPTTIHSGHDNVISDVSSRTERLEISGISEDRPPYSLRSSGARQTVEGNASGLQKLVNSGHVEQGSITRKRAAKASNVVLLSPQKIVKPNEQGNPSTSKNCQGSGYSIIDTNIIRLSNEDGELDDEADECRCHETGDNCSDDSCLNRATKMECPESCKAEDCANQRIGKKMHAKVYVSDTNTKKGYGLYAGEEIKEGQFIMEFVGEVISEKEDKKRRKKNPSVYRYTVKSGTLFYDATESGNEARFMNHSCAPNSHFEKWKVPGIASKIPRLAFFAVTDIPARGEITFDYLFGDELKECFCGAPSCRYKKQ